MNLNFNNRAHKLGLGQITPRGVDNRRTISADARVAGRKEPTLAASTGMRRMGVDRERSSIYSGSLAPVEADESRLLAILSNDIRPFQTLGTHRCELKALPTAEGMKWLNIENRNPGLTDIDKSVIIDHIEQNKTTISALERQVERLENERLEQEKNLKERREQLNKQERLMEAEQIEKKRIIREKEEEERQEKERQAEERLEKERLEKERLEKERLEKERLEKEQLEKERLEKERSEKERLEKERLEKERQEKEQQEKERLEKERLEKERLEKERLEKERLEKERLEKERLEKERLEKERLEKERQEKERLEKERLEKERLEKERLEKERLEKERLEKERLEKERLEKERLEKERLEKERIKREQMIKDPSYEIEVRKKQLEKLENSISVEKARRERISKRSKIEIYLFTCYHSHIADFVIKQYQRQFPSASIKICDNYTLSSEEEDRIREYGCRIIKYGEKDQDFDYDELSRMYNTVWRETKNEAWVIIAPGDTVVNVSQEKLQEFNDVGSNFINIDNYTMVSRSTKKDLSDIQLKTVNTGYKNKCDTVLCFNKSACPTIEYDVEKQSVAIKENGEKFSIHDEIYNSYVYKYMGLAFYVARVRQIHARQGQWRAKKYKGCVKKDINSISAEILSLPATTYMQNMK